MIFWGVIDFGVLWFLNFESWSECEVCDCGVGCWVVFLRVGDCEFWILFCVENCIINFDGVLFSFDLFLVIGDLLGVCFLFVGVDVVVVLDKEEGLGFLLVFICCGVEFCVWWWGCLDV